MFRHYVSARRDSQFDAQLSSNISTRSSEINRTKNKITTSIG